MWIFNSLNEGLVEIECFKCCVFDEISVNLWFLIVFVIKIGLRVYINDLITQFLHQLQVLDWSWHTILVHPDLKVIEVGQVLFNRFEIPPGRQTMQKHDVPGLWLFFLDNFDLVVFVLSLLSFRVCPLYSSVDLAQIFRFITLLVIKDFLFSNHLIHVYLFWVQVEFVE